MQTDQPYTYEIPAELEQLATVGMRVSVPFGRGGRLVQGFITNMREVKQTEQILKPIAQLEDLTPVLNDELLALADYMKDETFAFKITCLQTMLPAALKVKYDKWLVPISDAARNILTREILVDEAMQCDHWPKVKQLIAKQEIEVVYKGQQKTKIKTQRFIKKQITNDEIIQLQGKLKNAPKQQQILTVLSHMPDGGEMSLAQLKDEYQLTKTHLNSAANKGWLVFEDKEVYRQIQTNYQTKQNKKQLNSEQTQVYQTIQAKIGMENQVYLLKGITGSGKTEVYLHLIEDALAKNLTALMLVPEITLTPQMVMQLQQRFTNDVAVLHSGLSQGERYDEWRKIKRGEAKVVIGARSAIFAPLNNLGLIIIDEEHEQTYKQEDTPRYHAREIAKWRSQYHHCPLVLGSATPSLESMARAVKGNYQLLELTKRANPKAVLPQIQVVDLTQAEQIKPMLSKQLVSLLADRLAKNEQSVLLLNRRGYNAFMLCEDCGHVLECPNCSVSLTRHKDINGMKCHYCGHTEKIPHECPICQSHQIQFFGAGTQQIEEYLQELFPEAKIVRMDVDNTRQKGQHEKLLAKMQSGEGDILLGTQMIAKGLDFPNVTFVGVLNADTALNLPDFRASERTFQLLTQVSGRAGRAEKQGEVLIQTYNPKHYAIQFAMRHQYDEFFKYEMQVRHLGNYPPYYYTIQIIISHKDDMLASYQSQVLLKKLQPYQSQQMYLLGPTKTNIERINQKYYYQIIIKYKNDPELMRYLKKLLSETQYLAKQGYQIKIDHEPNQFI